MILADTSAWIAFFRDSVSETSHRLRRALVNDKVVMGDLVFVELFQGFRHPAEIGLALSAIAGLDQKVLCGPALAPKAAANYRALRQRGITIRGTIDVIIATWCLENGAALLHDDRDFDVLERHLGLSVWR